MTSKLSADMDGWGEAQLLSRLGITWVPGDRTDQLIEKHFDALRAEVERQKSLLSEVAKKSARRWAEIERLRAELRRIAIVEWGNEGHMHCRVCRCGGTTVETHAPDCLLALSDI